jgi:DNA-binding XRE family transcriptional regulator
MPTPDEIRMARLKAELTQEQAAEVIGIKRIAWNRYENGHTAIPPALWELWLHKTGIRRLPFPRNR